MNAKYDKQRQSLLGDDLNKNRELNEPTKLYSQTVSSRGPILKQYSMLHEALQEFIHEKILERPVHVTGFGEEN